MQIITGIILAIGVAALAWKAGALSTSGGVAAAITGGLIFGLGGIAWAALLLTFFISSSALSRGFSRRKASLAEKYAKGNRRDWGQVLANGGLGAFLAVGTLTTSQPEWLWLCFAGAMAAVNADTWSTELGVLTTPRMITSGKGRAGTSEASPWQHTGCTGRASLIGIVAVLFMPDPAWSSTWG
jgi:uncharacterized membrane protein